MFINATSGTFVIFMLITALLIGPISICVYLLSNIWSAPLNDEVWLNELQLNTHVGCSDGLFYLPMFVTSYHDRMVAQLGHFSTIIALMSIATLYKRKIRGKLTLLRMVWVSEDCIVPATKRVLLQQAIPSWPSEWHYILTWTILTSSSYSWCQHRVSYKVHWSFVAEREG